jgi:hypothetical protein
MALISTLVDDFNDGIVDPVKWPNSFGTYSETGGRARVTCDTGFNAYSSALNWTLAESAVYLRGYPPAAGGASTEAWAQILIKSDVGGTDLGFELRALTGELVMFSRTGYFDAGAVNIPYSATAHAWLRVRETGGTTYWDTSPDAATWTNRRTLTSPTWVSAVDLEFQLIAHRDSGTVDYAEFDNVNITGTIVALGTASEPDTAQTLGARKTKALPLATGIEAAQQILRSKTKTLTAGLEVEQALPLGRRKTRLLAPAVDIEAGFTLSPSKARTLATATEVETAIALASRMGRDDIDVTVGQPYSPWSVGAPQGATWPVGQPN